MGSTWFTTLDAIRRGEPDWGAIACYREPIARFLDRVFPRQEVLGLSVAPDRGLPLVVGDDRRLRAAGELGEGAVVLSEGGLGLATRPRLRLEAYALRTFLAGKRPSPVLDVPVAPGAARDLLPPSAEEPR